MLSLIYDNIKNLILLNSKPEVLFISLPLILTAIIMTIYFERYSRERPGWNSYVAGSLVLVFVSLDLLRYIFLINSAGAINYLDYTSKSIASLFLLLIGLIILRFNFEHILPEKLADHISTPITTNLLAYIVVLFVHTKIENSLSLWISLIIIFILIWLIIYLIIMPIKKLNKYIKKEKLKEELRDAKQVKFEISELKNEIKFKENILKKARIKELEKQKTLTQKIEKILKK